MRFVLYSLFLALWVLMWWWTYTCHIKTSCCPDFIEDRPAQIIEVDRDDPRPVVFRWGAVQPVATDRYAPMRDSLVAALQDGQMLEITGTYFRDELDPDAEQDLGLARATAMRQILGTHIDTSRIAVKSAVMDLAGDVRDKFFSALDFRGMKYSSSVRELEDRHRIYFTNTPEVDEDINDCLESYVEQAAPEGNVIALISHAHGAPSARQNLLLSTERAEFVRDALVDRGVPVERITIDSRGSSDEPYPGGSDKENTCVEIQIIQSN